MMNEQHETADSQENAVVELETKLQLQQSPRIVNLEAVDNTKLTYRDLGISSEEILGMIDTYTLTSTTVYLTKEKLAKIVQHHIALQASRNNDQVLDHEYKNARTFTEVLNSRICHLKVALAKLCESAGGNPCVHTLLEITRFELTIRNLMYIKDSIDTHVPPCKHA